MLSGDAYRSKRADAQRMCHEADALGDDAYVALAQALDGTVWTHDREFQRIPGLRIVGTVEVDGRES